MRLDILGEWELPHFDSASLRIEGYLLLGLYIALLAVVLYLRRNDFRDLLKRKSDLLSFVALLLLTVLLNNILWLHFPNKNILPPPGVPTAGPAPSLPLLGSVSVLLVGVLFGGGPALLAGSLAGLVRGGLYSSRVFASFEIASWGLVVGFLLQQSYRGMSGRLMRQPLVAALIGSLGHWMLLFLNVYAATEGSSLNALDYTQSLLVASIGAVALGGLIGGLFGQLLYAVAPGLKPVLTGTVTPPYLRSMNRRLLIALVPLTLVMILAMFYAVTRSAIKEATHQVVTTMVRDANNAADTLPLFFNTGQELLKNFASAQDLRSDDEEVRQRALESFVRTGVYGPFFNQLILYSDDLQVLNAYPRESPLEPSGQERMLLTRTVQFGSPERSRVFGIGQDQYVMDFIAPIHDGTELDDIDEDGRYNVLLGRTRITLNPMIRNLLDNLRWLEGGAHAFIVDDQQRIVIHPDESMLLTEQSLHLDCPDELSVPSISAQVEQVGTACRDLDPYNTRRLVYYRPVEAAGGWTIVISYPYESVLDRATRTSGPLLLILVIVTAVLSVTVPWVTSRLTRPLQSLSAAARRIAAGQLNTAIRLAGEDEVGQLGRAFERMRLSLKDRLEDLSLLLRVSQAVSSSLDLTQVIPPILSGALQATEACSARLILLDEHREPQVVMAQGENRGYITTLDRAVTRLALQGKPVAIEDVTKAKDLVDPELVGSSTRSLVVVPIRSKAHDVGIMWLGYDRVHTFNTTEIHFLSMLASQAAVAVENARLFQAAEGGRRRLSAILESTNDVIIVTDQTDRVLLFNPAAADAFGAASQVVSGVRITDVIEEEKVIRLLTAPLNNGVPLTDEIPLSDGRTLYASASVIVSSDGQAIGRVAVMRDITYLKELDQMKSDFVATVSHDLRAPLTFMRGYATMIPMVGEVTPKQQSYVEKIMVGIDQMTELIEDLLDLGRIEAGVGLRREPFRLDEIIVTLMESMRARAAAKRVTLRLERAEDVTAMTGDAALIRHAISNLIDNAIKYTPEGGTVTVGWETRQESVLVWVRDTGIGIGKADQVRLFEKFYRVKRRDTIEIKGSGLGLAIVKSIVERHNGRVWVDSELEQGSTFYIEFPMGQELDQVSSKASASLLEG